MLNRVFASTLLTGAAFAVTTPAAAATFVWNGGNYIPGTTSPNPLLSPDVLSLQTAASKVFGGGSAFTNASGTVDWRAGAVFLGGGTTVTNAGLWDSTDDLTLTVTTGGGTFANSGIFRKSGGTGVTAVNSVVFNNTGVVDAQTGTIRFSAVGSVFNGGSSFTGAGVADIASSAGFNGAISSANLLFTNGTFTGTNAVLSGQAGWNAGSFAGTWTLASGATLSAGAASSKVFSGTTFNNEGTIDWTGGAIFLGGGATVNNAGLWDGQADLTLTVTTGGGTFNNSGTFRKSGGTGVTAVNSVVFNNTGVVDAQTGTIRFSAPGSVFNGGSSFTGAGVVDIASSAAFNGAISSTNLLFTGGTATGTNAVLSGQATWNAGSLAGSWTIDSGATFTLSTASSTGTTTVSSNIGFDNNGTIDVRSGTIALPTNFDNDGTLTGTGTFSLSGTLTNDGVIAPGAGAGTLTLNGNYFQTAVGSFNVQLASTSLADLFVVNGTASLGGTLNLSCILSCAISTGDVFTLLDSSGNLSGTFANVTTSGFRSGFAYDLTYDLNGDRVLLTVLNAGTAGVIPEPASWAMMIAGFGLAGAAARRRQGGRVTA